jgi:hypothetical protein
MTPFCVYQRFISLLTFFTVYRLSGTEDSVGLVRDVKRSEE